ncbi:MAG: rhombosortase [Gammaproteobacteria bacterium]|nr:rhombosortase [Gammaproteobacteria bacterium]
MLQLAKPSATTLSFSSLLLVSLLLMFLSPEQVDWLRFDREGILAGEWWRLLSANVVHLGWGHYIMNALGALLVLFFFGSCLSALGWIISFAVGCLFIAGMILWLNPEILWYVGLSGVLHSLFVVGGLANIRVRPLEGWLFLTAVAAKLVWEQVFGALPGSEEMAGGPVLTEAHLYGALAGVLIWPLLRRLPRP